MYSLILGQDNGESLTFDPRRSSRLNQTPKPSEVYQTPRPRLLSFSLHFFKLSLTRISCFPAAADQSRIMQEQMTGAAMAMPPDPNKAFKVSLSAVGSRSGPCRRFLRSHALCLSVPE